jgi:hypothetical protein
MCTTDFTLFLARPIVESFRGHPRASLPAAFAGFVVQIVHSRVIDVLFGQLLDKCRHLFLENRQLKTSFHPHGGQLCIRLVVFSFHGMDFLNNRAMSGAQFPTDVDEESGIEHAVDGDNGVPHWLRNGDAAALIVKGRRLDGDCIGILDILWYGDLHGLYGVFRGDANWDNAMNTGTKCHGRSWKDSVELRR